MEKHTNVDSVCKSIFKNGTSITSKTDVTNMWIKLMCQVQGAKHKNSI